MSFIKEQVLKGHVVLAKYGLMYDKPKWKPLHERIVDEMINGKDEKEER